MPKEPMNLPYNAHVRVMASVPGADLENPNLPQDVLEDAYQRTRVTAEQRATAAGRRLVDDGRYVGKADPPDGGADVLWLAWDYDTVPNGGDA